MATANSTGEVRPNPTPTATTTRAAESEAHK